MSEMNWYESENWYAPLYAGNPEQKETTASLPQKRRRVWIPIVATVLVLSLIIGSALAFSHGSGQQPQLPVESGEEKKDEGSVPFTIPGFSDDDDGMPDDRDEFFNSFYEKIDTSTVEVNIARAELPADFELSLHEHAGEELSLQQLYERCSPSIVAIAGYMDGKTGYNWGTGVILSEDGLILTNTHVLEDCDRATVTLFDDREFEATLVGADTISDIAILKIQADDLPAAEFGESGSLVVGDHVAAIGNPLGETFRSTLTDGIISAISRGISYKGRNMTLLQTNTALNEGNSGGALFNMYGQVIGITNMKMISSSIEGIGFAIPSSTVLDVVNSIVRDGEVRGRPSIGITVGAIPDEAMTRYEIPSGLYISDVVTNSDAYAKGIRPGDILLEVNHIPVSTTTEVGEIKDAYGVGDYLTFTIWRNGEVFEVDVQLMDTNDLFR